MVLTASKSDTIILTISSEMQLAINRKVIESLLYESDRLSARRTPKIQLVLSVRFLASVRQGRTI
jgi:hypothetical protein